MLMLSVKTGYGWIVVVIGILFGVVVAYGIPRQIKMWRLHMVYKFVVTCTIELMMLVMLFVMDYKFLETIIRTFIHIFAYMLLEI